MPEVISDADPKNTPDANGRKFNGRIFTFGDGDIVKGLNRVQAKYNEDELSKTTLLNGVDYVFVTVGIGKLFEDALKYLKKGGSAILVGMPPSQDSLIPYDVLDITGNNLSIMGSKMGQTVIDKDVPLIIDLWRKGNYHLDELISGRYSLDNINDAIDETRRGDAKRNVIVFD